ncbi:MAG: YjfB family protein [Cellulosilyticaceae bacterium]
MDIAALSMMMSQQNLGVQVGVAVTKMAMDTTEQTNQFMADMLKGMELSVNPHIGSQIDIKL